VSLRKNPEKDDVNPDVETGSGKTQETAAETAAADPQPAKEKELSEQIAKLQAEKQELLNTLVHRQADFENYRKRIERERHQESHRAVAALIEHLLPVFDAFDRALAAHDDPAYEEYRKGVELIQRRMWDELSKQGLARIEAVGKPFDPRQHHAIERVESEEYDDGTVLEELQAGYRFHDRVLRPAMVRVAVHRGRKAAEGNSSIN
jgi:molecular chaperone GrpE